jgi:dATP pyrophosphohydrolase
VEDGESPVEAALRETKEEIGLEGTLFSLDTRASVPKTAFLAHSTWPNSLYIVEEHAFAIELATPSLTLSPEHKEFDWLDYESAFQRLRWQSNQTALWELNQRIRDNNLTESFRLEETPS